MSKTNKPVKIALSDSVKDEQLKVEPVKDIQIYQAETSLSSKSTEALITFKEQQKSGIRTLFWPAFSTFVIGAATYQAYQFTQQLFNTHWLLGSAAVVVGGMALLSGGFALVKSWRSRKRLRKRKQLQEQFNTMSEQQTHGQALQPLSELSEELNEFVDISDLEKQYLIQHKQFHSDHELIQIYSGSVLNGLDKMALQIISKHSSEAAVMVALSPLAAADMALVAWRSSRMIQELSRLYGCPQTAWGRFDLSKQVFKNMMLAGASEMIAEAGAEMLGKTLTATISTKVAQGIGVGVLISRMGIQTMKLCRPIAFTEQDKPSLKALRKLIVTKVKKFISKNEQDTKQNLSKD